MKAYTAKDLLKRSMGFEKDAHKLYKNWAKAFSREPDVAAFWRDYSEDESTHLRLLKELRARLSRDQLATLIECEVVGDTRRLLDSLKRDHKIEDLEQAIQFANQLEHSEINPLFITLVSFFETDGEATAALRELLDIHIKKPINNFPKGFLIS